MKQVTGWKNQNQTGNSPKYESWRHGQSAKGIPSSATTTHPHERTFLGRLIGTKKSNKTLQEQEFKEDLEHPEKSAEKRVNEIETLRSHGYSDDDIMKMTEENKQHEITEEHIDDTKKTITDDAKKVGSGVKKGAGGVAKGVGAVWRFGKWVMSNKEKKKFADKYHHNKSHDNADYPEKYDYAEEMDLRDEQMETRRLSKKLETIKNVEHQKRLKAEIEQAEDNQSSDSIFGSMGA